MASIMSPATSFQDTKWRRVYEAKDFDKKGFVCSDDFAVWGKMAAKKLGVDIDDEGNGYWVTAGESYFGNTKSYDEWKEYFLAFMQNCPNYLETSQAINVTLFKGIDANKDGVVSVAEYKAFVTSLFPNMSDVDVEYGFNIIDENGDGVLSQSEVAIALTRYYYDAEDSKYKHFYGKWNE